MGAKDPRVDAYIARSAGFAKPILKRLRAEVHRTGPDVTEQMKWSAPHFNYKGMFCMMAGFKKHCIFGFWKHKLVVGPAAPGNAWARFQHITSIDDLPPSKTLAKYLRKAMQLNDAGVKVVRTPKSATRPVRMPADSAAALKKNTKAQIAFADFSPSHKREYIEWITEAKTADTRACRLTQALGWIAEGKSRNWKYERRWLVAGSWG
jgi:uncharacterized protein YdeI (YjbR/CyaY-like superfamily)